MSFMVRPAAIDGDAGPADLARFVVGRDVEGHWLALEIHGRAGGLFRSLEAALAYAGDETGHRPDGVHVSGDCLTLRL